MFTEIETELALALGIMALSVMCVGRSPFFRPRELTVAHFAIIVTGIFFGFGPIACYMISGGSLADEQMDNVLKAYAVVALFIVGLAVFPLAIRFIFPNYKIVTIWEIFSAASEISWAPVLIVHLATWAMRFSIAYYYGIFFYGTGTTDRFLAIPYQMVVMQNVLEFLETSAFIWAAIRIWDPKHRNSFLVALFVLSTGFLWAFLQGRRPMLIYSILFFYCYVAKSNVVRMRQIIIAGLFFGSLLFIGFPAFIRLRMSHELLGSEDDAIGHVYRTTMGASRISSTELNSYYQENMTERPLIIRFICKIAASQKDLPMMRGDAILNSIKWAIPSVIYTEKKNGQMTEQLIESFYYYPQIDTSITWPATGCADFGIAGGMGIGLLFAGFIWVIELWSRRVTLVYPLVAVSTVSGMLFVISNVESDPVELFCLIRTIGIVYVVARFLRLFGVSETLSTDMRDLTTAAPFPHPGDLDSIDESMGDGRFPIGR